MPRCQPGAVLIGPGMERGLDLKDELCRALVIVRLPYPDRGDPQIRARLGRPGGSRWEGVQVRRSLIQMSGRGIRSAEGGCTTYILDSRFLQYRTRPAFPAYWTEALHWGYGPRPWPRPARRSIRHRRADRSEGAGAAV